MYVCMYSMYTCAATAEAHKLSKVLPKLLDGIKGVPEHGGAEEVPEAAETEHEQQVHFLMPAGLPPKKATKQQMMGMGMGGGGEGWRSPSVAPEDEDGGMDSEVVVEEEGSDYGSGDEGPSQVLNELITAGAETTGHQQQQKASAGGGKMQQGKRGGGGRGKKAAAPPKMTRQDTMPL